MKTIPTAAEEVEKAKEKYYSDPKAEKQYEKAFCLGWLESSYDAIAYELRELKNKKK